MSPGFELYHINIEDCTNKAALMKRVDVFVEAPSKEVAHDIAKTTRNLMFGLTSDAMIDVAWTTYEAEKMTHLKAAR